MKRLFRMALSGVGLTKTTDVNTNINTDRVTEFNTTRSTNYLATYTANFTTSYISTHNYVCSSDFTLIASRIYGATAAEAVLIPDGDYPVTVNISPQLNDSSDCSGLPISGTVSAVIRKVGPAFYNISCGTIRLKDDGHGDFDGNGSYSIGGYTIYHAIRGTSATFYTTNANTSRTTSKLTTTTATRTTDLLTSRVSNVNTTLTTSWSTDYQVPKTTSISTEFNTNYVYASATNQYPNTDRLYGGASQEANLPDGTFLLDGTMYSDNYQPGNPFPKSAKIGGTFTKTGQVYIVNSNEQVLLASSWDSAYFEYRHMGVRIIHSGKQSSVVTSLSTTTTTSMNTDVPDGTYTASRTTSTTTTRPTGLTTTRVTQKLTSLV